MKKNEFIKYLLITVISVLLISSNCCLSVFAEMLTIETENIAYEFTINDDFADDRVLVVFTHEASWQFKEYEPDDFSEIGCKSVKAMATTKFERGKKALENITYAIENNKEPVIDLNLDLSNYNNILCLELEHPGKQNVLDAIKELKKRDDVLYAEPDYKVSLVSDFSSEIFTLTEDDELYYKTYLGLSDETNGRDARRLVDFDEQLTIGIIDSGIDTSREFYRFGQLVSPQSVNFTYYDEYDPDEDYVPDALYGSKDVQGHGTHVAGIIASTVDDCFYFGVENYGGDAVLLSVRAFDENANAEISSVICAIDYLNKRGVPIINFSAGAYLPFQYMYNDSTLKNAIEDYTGLFVCAAGNGDDYNNPVNIDATPFFPAAWDIENMITVGASDANDEILDGTNFGKTTVDIFAPGENIYSCYPLGSDFCSENLETCPHADTHISYGYHSLSGTSMATGFVSGVAALVIQAYNENAAPTAPDITAEDVKYIIMQSANKYRAAFEDKCVSDGRLDAYAAVKKAIGEVCIHSNVNYTYNSTSHRSHCIECNYQSEFEPHAFSVVHIYDGDNGCDIGCLDCEYSFHCDCNPKYGAPNMSGHYVSCPDGVFSFFEEHSSALHTIIPNNLYYHNAYCYFCDYTYTESHTWTAVIGGYTCTDCGITSTIIPGIMSLSDEELALMLATLSDEELAELTLALNEDDRGRIAALLPEREDDLANE